jgi:hypothetical protein
VIEESGEKKLDMLGRRGRVVEGLEGVTLCSTVRSMLVWI